MGFVEAIKTCLSKYVTFSGRARRSEYWWFYLFAILMGIIPFIGPILSLALFLPNLAVTVRRLHDIDKSGWWLLGFYGAIAVVVGIAAAIGGDIMPIVAGVIVVVMAIIFIVWLATKGTDGPNRFGDDPFGVVNKDVFS